MWKPTDKSSFNDIAAEFWAATLKTKRSSQQETIRETTPMLNTATKTEATDTQQELTDGFHLVIDALKLNGINTVYGVPGIPITDLGRMAQAACIRVISFRTEQ